MIVLGGPMSANDPEVAGEVEEIRRGLRNGVPILGICLGSQLIAKALGSASLPESRAGDRMGAGSSYRRGQARSAVPRYSIAVDILSLAWRDVRSSRRSRAPRMVGADPASGVSPRFEGLWPSVSSRSDAGDDRGLVDAAGELRRRCDVARAPRSARARSSRAGGEASRVLGAQHRRGMTLCLGSCSGRVS